MKSHRLAQPEPVIQFEYWFANDATTYIGRGIWRLAGMQLEGFELGSPVVFMRRVYQPTRAERHVLVKLGF